MFSLYFLIVTALFFMVTIEILNDVRHFGFKHTFSFDGWGLIAIFVIVMFLYSLFLFLISINFHSFIISSYGVLTWL